jgi:hypothetical protein
VKRLTQTEFREVGALLLGNEWQRPLAKMLGPYHPDGPRATIDPRLIQRWASGERPVAEWVTAALVTMLLATVPGVEQRAAEMRRVAAKLEGTE